MNNILNLLIFILFYLLFFIFIIYYAKYQKKNLELIKFKKSHNIKKEYFTSLLENNNNKNNNLSNISSKVSNLNDKLLTYNNKIQDIINKKDEKTILRNNLNCMNTITLYNIFKKSKKMIYIYYNDKSYSHYFKLLPLGELIPIKLYSDGLFRNEIKYCLNPDTFNIIINKKNNNYGKIISLFGKEYFIKI